MDRQSVNVNRSAKVELTWADGDHTFRLAIGELRELQEKCNAGPLVILNRIMAGSWLVDDVRETLRIGLIGGGKSADQARKLVERYVDPGPIMENGNVRTAQAVLMAAIVGAGEEEPVGKTTAAGDQTTHSQTGSSPSPPSTEPEPSSATPRERSIN